MSKRLSTSTVHGDVALLMPSAAVLPVSLRRAMTHKAGAATETGGPLSGVSWDWIINFVAPMIAILIPVLSSALRDQLQLSLAKWKKIADTTTSPWDNFVIEFISKVLGITLP
jgi:hypothetical protein